MYSGTFPDEGDVRLVNGYRPAEGRVESVCPIVATCSIQYATMQGHYMLQRYVAGSKRNGGLIGSSKDANKCLIKIHENSL